MAGEADTSETLHGSAPTACGSGLETASAIRRDADGGRSTRAMPSSVDELVPPVVLASPSRWKSGSSVKSSGPICKSSAALSSARPPDTPSARFAASAGTRSFAAEAMAGALETGRSCALHKARSTRSAVSKSAMQV